MMARYIWTIEGCNHKFSSRQEALEYAGFDRWIEEMHGKPPGIFILSKHTPEQYKRYLKRKEMHDETST
jgi:hypothetical protein